MPTTKAKSLNIAKTAEIFCFGWSTRWMVESLTRAGIRCSSADIFGDWDLCQLTNSTELKSLNDMGDFASRLSRTTMIFGSGFETNLELAESIANSHLLLNSNARSVRELRNPQLFGKFAKAHSIAFPDVCPVDPAMASAGKWLCKSKIGAGGKHVEKWPLMGQHETASDSNYLQQFIEGQPLSASFIATKRECQLLAVFEQLLGESVFGAERPFQFVGVIGPLHHSKKLGIELLRIGSVIQQHYEMKGLFGIDFILDRFSKPWVIEVNPRPTSSMELFERAAANPEFSLMAHHLDSFDGIFNRASIEWPTLTTLRENGPRGKAIIFAKGNRPFTVTESFFSTLKNAWSENLAADIPKIGKMIQPGDPIATIFSQGKDHSDTRANLELLAKVIDGAVEELQRHPVDSER